ncbi:MAG: hypothetical protein AB7F78_09160 [Hyphomicrobiaceae bacterium]
MVERKDAILAKKFIAYGASAIVYEFQFKISENNKAKAEVLFSLPFTKGVFDLGVKGGLDKDRYTERTYKATDTFAQLVRLPCENFVKQPARMLYPITGSIGLD